MTYNGILQILAYLLILTLLTKPMGIFLQRVFDGGRTVLEPVIGPVERLVYRFTGVDPEREMNWKQYGVAMIVFSFVSSLALYAIQRFQSFLPLNPRSFTGPSADSSFNTAVSFVTNTNWQGYSGEATMSYLSQMTGLAVQNFVSAAVGLALAIVFIRGIARFETDKLGNFWVDLVRGTLYVLLPLSLLTAVFFVSQGVIQNFKPYDVVHTIDGATQTVAQGPVASQLAIKMLGTNGGGFFNANSAHPFENPSPLTNFVEMLLIMLIPAGLTYTLGRMVRSQGHGWAVYAAMMILLASRCIYTILRRVAGKPTCIRQVSIKRRSAVISKAKKRDLASQIQPCSPRSRPTHRAVPLIRCMTALLRSAGWFRWSTYCSARSFSEA